MVPGQHGDRRVVRNATGRYDRQPSLISEHWAATSGRSIDVRGKQHQSDASE